MCQSTQCKQNVPIDTKHTEVVLYPYSTPTVGIVRGYWLMKKSTKQIKKDFNRLNWFEKQIVLAYMDRVISYHVFAEILRSKPQPRPARSSAVD